MYVCLGFLKTKQEISGEDVGEVIEMYIKASVKDKRKFVGIFF